MSEVQWNLMEILYKRGYVEYHDSLNANVLKEYNLEVPGLTRALPSNVTKFAFFEKKNQFFKKHFWKKNRKKIFYLFFWKKVEKN